jgi:hypothetical protein
MLIKLGLALDYPIEWDFKTVIRDFVQNFYDSIGYCNFAEKFEITYNKNTVMQTKGHSFNYQWLMYIGASTKTDKPSEYIGQYGEGFKMGVLSCMQHEWCVPIMESEDWTIKPYIYEESIDGKNVKMLGYEKEERIDDGYTRLILEDLPMVYWRRVEESILNFYYAENPLIGEKIAESEMCIIHERSDEPIPGIHSGGILFCNYLARAALNINYIILYRKDLRKDENRSRTTYNDLKTMTILMECTRQMNPQMSYTFLTRLYDIWNVLPNSNVDPCSNYYLICQLVRNVASDEGLCEKFRQEYNNLAYIERNTIDKNQNSMIDETKQWVDNIKNKDFKLVNPIFRLLGARSLVLEYKSIKSEIYLKPTQDEKYKINIIYETIEKICAIKLYDKRPEVKIKESSDETPIILNVRKRYSSNRRDRRKITFDTVVINRTEYLDIDFKQALLNWYNLLANSFGTTKCAHVNALLTDFIGYCVKYRNVIEEKEEKWNVRK